MKKEITLKGKGFVLRQIKKSDVTSLTNHANNKTVAKNCGKKFPNPYTIKDAHTYTRMLLKEYKKGLHQKLIIDIDGKLVGTIGGDAGKDKPFIFSFGYWLSEKYWGKGVVSEAVKLYTDYIFKTAKPTKIVAHVFPWNKASMKVLEKNSFKLDGILRKDYDYNGKIIDQYYYSKLRNGK